MPVDLNSAASNLSEKTKKFQIALYYTSGDEEKARKMVSGSYLDLYIIKGKFSSSNAYGAFIIFLNIPELRVVNIYSIISRSFELADIKTNQDWRVFEDRLVEIVKKGDYDDVMSAKVNEALAKSINMHEIDQLSQLIEQDNGIAVNHNFQRFFSDATGFQNVGFSVDYENISSLAMEMQSLTSEKISNQKMKNKNQTIDEEYDPNDPLAGLNVRLLVKGSLVLSPIKGKNISELAVDDRVMISIIDNDDKAVELLQVFNAYNEDGTTKPIVGRIVSINHTTNYEIYAVVARGIYARIVEDENFIKVAIYSPNFGEKNDHEAMRNKLIIYILSIIFILLLVAIFMLLVIIFKF